jgi:hypothetical protein
VLAQSLWRMQRDRKRYVSQLQSRVRQRAAVARELFDTEQRYVTDLESVIEARGASAAGGAR